MADSGCVIEHLLLVSVPRWLPRLLVLSNIIAHNMNVCSNNMDVCTHDIDVMIYMLFAGREVRIGKNCARGLAGVRPEAAGRGPYARPRAQFLTYTDRPRPVNNLFIFFSVLVFKMIDAVRFANSLPALLRTVTR